MITKKIYMNLVLLLAGAFILVSCGSDENEQVSKGKIQVKTETVKMLSVPQEFEFAGNVEGSRKVKLSTKLMGEIEYLPFEAGSKIKKGQTLVKIRSKDLDSKMKQIEANLTQAKAKFTTVKKNYERIKDLYDKESASKKEFEDIETAYKMTKAQVEAVEAMKKELEDVLSYAVLKAPFDGYIVNKFFEEGDISAPGHPILIVEKFGTFEVVATASASEINKINNGKEVLVKIDALGENYFNGKVVEVNPGAHPASRQFTFRVKLNKENSNLDMVKSGMYAKVLLKDEAREIVAVPNEMIVKKGQLNGVYTVNQNNEAMLRWLRLGRKIDNKYEVLSGLREGEVIIAADKDVREGIKVEVVQ